MLGRLVSVCGSFNLTCSKRLIQNTDNVFQSATASSKRFLHFYSESDGTEIDTLYKNIDIELKGHELAVMKSYEEFVSQAAKELDIKISKIWTPPRDLRRWTLLKSAFIYKIHRVQYEARTNFKVIQLEHLTGSTANTFLEYIQRNLPEGMAMKVTRQSVNALPIHLH